MISQPPITDPILLSLRLGWLAGESFGLLGVVKYSALKPCLAFNYDTDTSRNWRDFRQDVLSLGLGTYDTLFAAVPDRGLVLELE